MTRADPVTEPLSLIQRCIYSVLSSCTSGLGNLDFPGIRRLAPRLGALLWAALPSRRALAARNIRDCLKLSEAEANSLARESFNHNAQSFLEAVLIPRFGFDHPALRVVNPERFARFSATPSPIVISSGHIGAWELQAGLLGEFQHHNGTGQERPCMVVVRRNSNPALNRLMMDLRSSRGLQVVGHREAVFTVLKGLRRHGVAAFLVDHNAGRSEALFLPFLGRPAAVNMGPALLAVRTGAEIWPTSILRHGDTYHFCLEEPLCTASLSGERDDKIRAAATFYTEAAERFVRRAPEQWFWMHNRWKTKE